jgi:hypothetical protein
LILDTLGFAYAIRTGTTEHAQASKSERTYIDFLISEQPLAELLNTASLDLIGTLGWAADKVYENNTIDQFLGIEKPELSSGRTPFYVCPECGDIGCGAITAEIEITENEVTWKNFGYENNEDEPNLTDYKEIGPFHFNKAAYIDCFKEIKQKLK